ncbi:MAG: hypothetical protein LKJ22_08430 [Liquorilactobacillus nagelii]|jgi:hypothetical protein|uniref:hypothetical protein n=1 Tax=Liquorilactobacillus nagelii TaxID=82688 RepID=UPI00242F2A1A|nr:hypothetical protein [Liquorilactobacillus nagelii]MCI1921932.1 hypothetical protein [Liquorilactobacillus nagelii]MCI1976420.1 hypothetical protein [Liquorilactobacillus nagelii]
MHNDSTTVTYLPESNVISIDSKKPLSPINTPYNNNAEPIDDIIKQAERVINSSNKSQKLIEGDAVTMNNQNDYVTQRELDEKFGRISDKIDSSEKYLKEHIEKKSAETNGKIDVLTQSINDFKQSFPQTVNLAVRDEFDKRDKERKETNRFIIGTLVIGGISLIVSIASVIVSIFIH